MRFPGLIIIVLFLTSCITSIEDEGEPSPSLNWNTKISDNYFFYFRPYSQAQSFIEVIVSEQEAAFLSVLKKLDVAEFPPITIYILDSKDMLYYDAGEIKNSLFYTNGIQAYYTKTIKNVGLVGESEKLITPLILHNAWCPAPSEFLSDGMAFFAEDDILVNTGILLNVHQIAKNKKLEGSFPPIRDIIDNYSKERAPLAGSFFKFLVKKFGITKVKEFYCLFTPGNYPEEVKTVFGQDLTVLESEWHQVIDFY